MTDNRTSVVVKPNTVYTLDLVWASLGRRTELWEVTENNIYIYLIGTKIDI